MRRVASARVSRSRPLAAVRGRTRTDTPRASVPSHQPACGTGPRCTRSRVCCGWMQAAAARPRAAAARRWLRQLGRGLRAGYGSSAAGYALATRWSALERAGYGSSAAGYALATAARPQATRASTLATAARPRATRGLRAGALWLRQLGRGLRAGARWLRAGARWLRQLDSGLRAGARWLRQLGRGLRAGARWLCAPSPLP